MKATPPKIYRRFEGIISATRMTGVVTVVVEKRKWSAKYKTQYRLTDKFPASAQHHKLAVGDRVLIEETRPRSRRVRWAVVKKMTI